MSLGKSKTQNLQLSQDPDRSNSYVSVDCRAADRQTRIIIISDARLYREGLAVSLSTIYRLVVVGLASTLAEALNCIKERRPDVALLDITMPDALTLPEAVAAGSVPVKIVAFSVAETEDEICACAEAGVVGFVARNGSMEDLVAAVENAVRGEVACSPKVAGSLFRRLAARARTTGQPGPEAILTIREHEIIALIDRGLSNKEIARQLNIRAATVKNHVHNILEKLQVRRRGAAAAVLRERAAVQAALHRPPRQQSILKVQL
jgi:DNA-binding NarL/FixJ family response regulator